MRSRGSKLQGMSIVCITEYLEISIIWPSNYLLLVSKCIWRDVKSSSYEDDLGYCMMGYCKWFFWWRANAKRDLVENALQFVQANRTLLWTKLMCCFRPPLLLKILLQILHWCKGSKGGICWYENCWFSSDSPDVYLPTRYDKDKLEYILHILLS